MKAPSSVRLHIEELVLQGFAPGDRHAISEAVQSELARLLADRPLPAMLHRGRSHERVDGGSVRLAGGAGASAVGAQIAGAIHGGLDR